MALEDFERDLAESQAENHKRKRQRSRSPRSESRRHKHRHRHDGESSSKHHRSKQEHHNSSRNSHRHTEYASSRKEARKSHDNHALKSVSSASDDEAQLSGVAEAAPPTDEIFDGRIGERAQPTPKRDDWMLAPSALDVDYVQRKKQKSPPSKFVRSQEVAQDSHQLETELEHGLGKVDGDDNARESLEMMAQHKVDYIFGDAGSSWRMTKLRGAYTRAKESERPIGDVAKEQYDDLRAFDDAREEETELDRRKTYGEGYVGKEKPSGELFQERKLEMGIRRESHEEDEKSNSDSERPQGEIVEQETLPVKTVALDQTALNKLKAQMMKAKLLKAPSATDLEAQYNAAISNVANNRQSDVVVLDRMESRMLAGGRKGEVKDIDNKRGRERGNVAENEDMSIDDMVRQEKRTRGIFGGNGKDFAERIAKDSKFDNDLDYMADNAEKLARSVQKSDVNLRNTAVADYQKMKRVLDTCPLCHHEDTSTPPQAPIVSLATRTFLTLPTSPEITSYGLCASIVPIQHRLNLLECDDDEWDEIRNFMKSLTRFYYSLNPRRSVIFYENAAHDGRKRHASMEAIPLPLDLGETAPQFFKEAILSSDEEWTQHRKIIDTLAKAEDGAGKLAFRRSMVSELPYFHVWFRLDGGLGHVVEDSRRWPRGDLFAREIIGGMLDVGPEVIKKQGRWRKGDPEMENRIKKFAKSWTKFDWTSVLVDA